MGGLGQGTLKSLPGSPHSPGEGWKSPSASQEVQGSRTERPRRRGGRPGQEAPLVLLAAVFTPLTPTTGCWRLSLKLALSEAAALPPQDWTSPNSASAAQPGDPAPGGLEPSQEANDHRMGPGRPRAT